MDKFIPYEKLSKKQRRELNAQRREMWAISPVTRKPANPKAYNRRKTRKWINDDSHSVSSVFYKESPALLHPRPRKEVSIAADHIRDQAAESAALFCASLKPDTRIQSDRSG